MSVAPGWYVDPADRDTRRYWDGGGWIGAPIPVDAEVPEGPPEPEPEPTPAQESTSGGPASGPPAATGSTGTGSGSPQYGPGQPGSGPAPGGAGPAQGGPAWPGAGSPPAGPSWPGADATGPGQGGPGQGGPGQGGPGQGGPGQGGPGQGGPGGPGWPAPGPGQPPWTGPGTPPGWPQQAWLSRPPEPRPHGFPLAGHGARLVARVIDFGVLFALNAVVNGWFVWRYIQEVTPYWREVMSRAMAGDSSTDGLPQPGDQAGGLQVAILLIATALWFAYEVPAMAASGQTFGKRVARIRAVPMAQDQPLGFGRSLRRWNTLGLPTLLWYCCGLGLILQLVDAVSPLFDHPLRRALHDKRAQTVVIQVPPATPPTAPTPPGETP
ncbi:RDD family protein [Micromonospora sp. WMMA1923]|uniref:RDD family protein n=1 Tax=Micromonospora sp. WMMA1923 TaxID=3404125 RepID=UPI003B965C36